MIEKRIVEVRDGRKWNPKAGYVEQPVTGGEVYKYLALDLSAQYLKGSPFIKSVRRIQNYTHLEILVTYDNGVRARYFLPATF